MSCLRACAASLLAVILSDWSAEIAASMFVILSNFLLMKASHVRSCTRTGFEDVIALLALAICTSKSARSGARAGISARLLRAACIAEMLLETVVTSSGAMSMLAAAAAD